MIYKVLHTIKPVKKHEFLKYCSKYLLFRFGIKGKCIFVVLLAMKLQFKTYKNGIGKNNA